MKFHMLQANQSQDSADGVFESTMCLQLVYDEKNINLKILNTLQEYC